MLGMLGLADRVGCPGRCRAGHQRRAGHLGCRLLGGAGYPGRHRSCRLGYPGCRTGDLGRHRLRVRVGHLRGVRLRRRLLTVPDAPRHDRVPREGKARACGEQAPPVATFGCSTVSLPDAKRCFSS